MECCFEVYSESCFECCLRDVLRLFEGCLRLYRVLLPEIF